MLDPDSFQAWLSAFDLAKGPRSTWRARASCRAPMLIVAFSSRLTLALCTGETGRG